ncbi:hypothetical protein GQ457_14G024040 [Hibiscus cannabinus]
MFHKDDDGLLNHSNEDGKSVEPAQHFRPLACWNLNNTLVVEPHTLMTEENMNFSYICRIAMICLGLWCDCAHCIAI